MNNGRRWKRKTAGLLACLLAAGLLSVPGYRMETFSEEMATDAGSAASEEDVVFLSESAPAGSDEMAEIIALLEDENKADDMTGLPGIEEEQDGIISLPGDEAGEEEAFNFPVDDFDEVDSGVPADGPAVEDREGLIEDEELPDSADGLADIADFIPDELTEDNPEDDLSVNDSEETMTEEAPELGAGSGSSQYQTAPEIVLGGTYNVDLTYGAGCQYFRFVPTATAYYRFRSISTFTVENQIDPVALIFSADGTMLAWHDDIDAGSGNRNFGLVILLQKGETYYMKAGVANYPAAYSFTVEKGDVADLSEKATDFEMWADGLQGMDVCPGGKVILVVGWSRSDDKIPTFTWEKAGVGILPETSNVLTVKAPETAGTYQSYDCHVTCDGVKAHNYDGMGLIRFTLRAEEDAHDPSDWTVTVPATVFDEGTEVRTCRFCGKLMEHRKIAKLESFITMNVAENSTLPLQVKQSTKAVKVTDLQEGDYVVSWESSKPRVASVSKAGKIKGKKKGKTTITVTTAAGAVYKFKVKVQTGRVKTKQVTAETGNRITIKKKEKIKLGAVVLPLTSLDKLTYATSSSKIATVKKGTVTGKVPGKATITVKAGTKTLKIRVKVIK